MQKTSDITSFEATVWPSPSYGEDKLRKPLYMIAAVPWSTFVRRSPH